MSPDLQTRVQQMMLQIVPFFLAIVFHEFGHGWAAKKFGDRTATDAGRLTLNPISHIDPIGTLAIPMLNMITGIPLLFGWAKPVPINPSRFSNYRKGLFWVALAGPLANVLLASVCAFAWAIFYRYMPTDFALADPITQMAVAAVQINFALAIFNLLPIPPLDGSRVLESFLSYNGTQKLKVIEGYSFFILIGLLWTGALSFLSGPIIHLSRLFLTLAGMTISAIP
jgi:Zn-dependent protease